MGKWKQDVRTMLILLGVLLISYGLNQINPPSSKVGKTVMEFIRLANYGGAVIYFFWFLHCWHLHYSVEGEPLWEHQTAWFVPEKNTGKSLLSSSEPHSVVVSMLPSREFPLIEVHTDHRFVETYVRNGGKRSL